jgi:hypothetical protein
MATQAHATTIMTDEQRWKGPDTSLSGRLAAAQAADREGNRARQSEAVPAQPEVQRITLDPEIPKLVHDIGISNQPESYAFVQRFLNY